ncbi:hypothetical protein C8F01DRAFT_1261149 [Mycena amicta]|nr:hypothetical protein C8F01DRAFT_1261149 [Mycena amicta]
MDNPPETYHRLDSTQNPLAHLRQFFAANRHLVKFARDPDLEAERLQPGIWAYRFEDFRREVIYERVPLDPMTATLLNTDFPCCSVLHTCTDCQAADPFVYLGADEDTVYAVLAHCTHRHFTQGRRRNLTIRHILRKHWNWVPPDTPRVRECLGGLMVVKLRRVAGATSPLSFPFESMPPDAEGESGRYGLAPGMYP